MHIINGKLITMENSYYEHGYVTFNKGKITDYGDMSNFKGDEDVYDADGGYILPGFIDSHCHIGIGPEAGGSIEYFETAEPITPHYRGIDSIYPFDSAITKAVSAGVTTVVAGPGSTNIIDGQLAAFKLAGKNIKEMVIMAPCAMKIALGSVPKSVFGKKNMAPYTRMATAQILREAFEEAREYKRKKEQGIQVLFNAKKEALIPVLDREIPVHVHASRTDSIMTAVQLTQEFNIRCLIIHGNESDEIADLLAATDVPIILGPMIFSGRGSANRESSFKTARILKDAGVLYAICTDHCQNMVSTEYLSVCAGLSVRYGLTDKEALESITVNAAKILGLDNKIGSISEGKDADISVFDGYPLEFKSKTKAVFIDGRRVK